MKFRKIIVTTLVLFVPLVVFFFAMHAIIRADSPDQPYSIIMLAGQSWAEGTNSFRVHLPAGQGPNSSLDNPADASTQFWWAGADGKGPANTAEFLNLFFNNSGVAGWRQSGGATATGQARMESLASDTQRSQLFGPELGIGRELYDVQGRRKVIILKISYGFQSLAQSNSPFVPFDFNPASTNKSYQRMKTEFNALTSYLHTTGQTYTVDGFYWIQGGTDALQQAYTDQYQTNFTNFTNSVRTDFQLHPDAHIVAAKMSMESCLENSYPTTLFNYCGFPWAGSLDPLVFGGIDTTFANFANRVKKVRGAIQTVADNDQNDRVKIDTVEMNDIPISNDHIHDSEQGNIIFGRRFVNMYKLPYRDNNSTDYDNDGINNSLEDTGTCSCNTILLPSCTSQAGGTGWHNGNLGDDDCDGDGYPNYLDNINGPGSGMSQ